MLFSVYSTVIFGSQLSVADTLSTNEGRLHLSVAIQDLLIVYEVVQSAFSSENISENTTVTFGSQLSIANTLAAAGGTAPQSNDISVGIPDNSGAVLSCIVMVCVAWLEFPQASVAIHLSKLEHCHLEL